MNYFLKKAAVIELIDTLLPTFKWVFPGLTVEFKELKGYSGYVDLPNRIVLCKKNPSLEAFFHELMHVYCYHQNIYPMYHKTEPELSNLDKYFKVALDAEQFVENSAAILCHNIFPEYTWQSNAYVSFQEQEDLYKKLYKQALYNRLKKNYIKKYA